MEIENNENQIGEEVNNEEIEVVEENEFTLKEALRDYRTYLIPLVVNLAMIHGSVLSAVYKNYGLENNPDDQFMTIVGTVGSIANGVSRNVWAIMLDKFQYKHIFSILLCIQIAIGFTMELIVPNKVLYMLWVAISYF